MKASWIVALVMAPAVAPSAAAQTESRAGRFRGRVSDAVTGQPVAGARVEVRDSDIHQVSDSGGRFTLVGLSPGQHVVRVRRIGYEEATDTIRVEDGPSSGEGAERVLVLRRVPVALKEMVVAGRTVKFLPFFEAAYKRAARGRGVFFTREDIEQAGTNDYQALFNRIPGVSANDRGVTFQRCQSGLRVVSDPTAKPKVQVWIDGFRQTPSTDAASVLEVLRSVKPYAIQIMEVYSSISTIPPEFNVDACAVIVIWTKRD